MANTRTKIERLGLHDYVVGLYSHGVVIAREIARRIEEEKGEKISEDAVRNHLATHVKPQFENAAATKIQEHVDRTVPQDLKALEEMEAQCIEWFRELPSEQAERLAVAAVEIESCLAAWVQLFNDAHGADEKKTRGVVRDIIKQCLALVTKDARQQDKRIKAIKMAVDIIALKIGKARELDDDQKGRIILVDRSKDYVPHDPNGSPGGQREKMRVVFGGKE